MSKIYKKVNFMYNSCNISKFLGNVNIWTLSKKRNFIRNLILSFTIFVSAPALSKELRCLSDMAYVEARAGGYSGIKDVVDVMFNRVKHHKFPSTICSNLYMKGQYPWVKQGMPNRNTKSYKKVSVIVEEIYVKKKIGILKDGTNGALYFNNKKFSNKKLKFLFKREGHYFYK